MLAGHRREAVQPTLLCSPPLPAQCWLVNLVHRIYILPQRQLAKSELPTQADGSEEICGFGSPSGPATAPTLGHLSMYQPVLIKQLAEMGYTLKQF